MANFYVEVNGVKHIVSNKCVTFGEIKNVCAALKIKGSFNKRKKAPSVMAE